MPVNYYPGRSNFGLLPEPEGRSASFFTSLVVNGLILALLLYIGATAKKVLEEHKYEETVLIVPTNPPPPPPKIKITPPPGRDPGAPAQGGPPGCRHARARQPRQAIHRARPSG